MKPFQPCVRANIVREKIAAMARDLTPETSDQVVDDIVAMMENVDSYINDRYIVAVFDVAPVDDCPAMVHLSIKRIDKEPIHDWRELQEIKNTLVGPDHEAIELYPAEERLVDTANQYHLFVLVDPKLRFPFGFTTRLVHGVSSHGAKQRPFEEETR